MPLGLNKNRPSFQLFFKFHLLRTSKYLETSRIRRTKAIVFAICAFQSSLPKSLRFRAFSSVNQSCPNVGYSLPNPANLKCIIQKSCSFLFWFLTPLGLNRIIQAFSCSSNPTFQELLKYIKASWIRWTFTLFSNANQSCQNVGYSLPNPASLLCSLGFTSNAYANI